MDKNTILKKLEELENIKYEGDVEEYYIKLVNFNIDIMNNYNFYDMEDLFNDIVDYDMATERAKYELEHGGLERLSCFLGDTNFNSEFFLIDGYGNLTNLNADDLDCIKSDMQSILEN